MVAYNEELYPPTPQDMSNVFSVADLSSQSSSDSAKYKRAWHKEKVICSSILSAGESPDANSRALYIATTHKESLSIMEVTGAVFPKIYANAMTRHAQNKNIVPCNISR